jgi:hypothetical protein
VTLAVHPLFGRELAVHSSYGPEAVWAETRDGKLRLLPLAWTSLRPRGEPLVHKGQAVRLAPEALLELAAWVGARAARSEPSPGEGEKFAPLNDSGNKARHGRGSSRRAVPAAAVVGEARSHESGGRGEQRPQGGRGKQRPHGGRGKRRKRGRR